MAKMRSRDQDLQFNQIQSTYVGPNMTQIRKIPNVRDTVEGRLDSVRSDMQVWILFLTPNLVQTLLLILMVVRKKVASL